MNRRLLLIGIPVLAVGAFLLASQAVQPPAAPTPAPAIAEALVRPHAPIMGKSGAKVTLVEFFDPACETCRRMYPVVKGLLQKYPDDLRVVLRYAPFHDGSEEVVRMIEAARLQDKFLPVVEALLAAQPEWADHSGPNLPAAWAAAEGAGLDIAKGRADLTLDSITKNVALDMADLKTMGVERTPTFFVNGKPLPKFGIAELEELVRSEVEALKSK